MWPGSANPTPPPKSNQLINAPAFPVPPPPLHWMYLLLFVPWSSPVCARRLWSSHCCTGSLYCCNALYTECVPWRTFNWLWLKTNKYITHLLSSRVSRFECVILLWLVIWDWTNEKWIEKSPFSSFFPPSNGHPNLLLLSPHTLCLFPSSGRHSYNECYTCELRS